ncbi:unnamed protein product [Fraxinus pennsylvanica]|uniref:Homeobox domain-containing protein n=1 Tax=Fraxinus pennsylvanica TaxID=56036 RepID=A0AAD2AF65_9LAMI|nr:unnamed protein product [Fraxinus pennsylvanica]
MAGRPWSFDKSLLCLHDCENVDNLKEIAFNEEVFWVQCHDLPFASMTQKMGCALGERLGKVLVVDTDSSGVYLGAFLPFKVLLDISKPMTRGCLIKLGRDQYWIAFKYERLANFCYHCGLVFHSSGRCVQKDQGAAIGEGIEQQFGPWLRATRKHYAGISLPEGAAQPRLNLHISNPDLSQTGIDLISGETVVEDIGKDPCADIQEMDSCGDAQPSGSELMDLGQSKNWKKRARSSPGLAGHQVMEVDGCEPNSWSLKGQEVEGSEVSTPKRIKQVQGEVDIWQWLLSSLAIHLNVGIDMDSRKRSNREGVLTVLRQYKMWMMECNDRGEFSSIQSSFNGRKFRPLVPKPVSAAASSPRCLNLINHDTDLVLNHHLSAMAEQSKREFSTQQVVVSSRWNPAPEQLQTLEALYRRGTRTPTAEQIQLITAQLRQYGKIEGKNVFYWFQNHKSRERQKRRRQIGSISEEQPHNNSERKESEANRTLCEVEKTKNWASSTNSSTIAEAEKAADGWLQIEETELQQRRNLVERKNSLQIMHLSCSSSHTKLINSTHTAMDPNHLKLQDFNVSTHKIPWSDSVVHDPCNAQCFDNCRESETLQLFPLRSCHENEGIFDKDVEVSAAAISCDFSAQYQFFEFLPLKN